MIPTTAHIAKALLARMVADGCLETALINDDSPYGQNLASNLGYYGRSETFAEHHRFVFNQSVGPKGRSAYLVKRVTTEIARQKRSGEVRLNCFVYSGTRNANTIQIFRDFAAAMPEGRLYGTNGVADTDFRSLASTSFASRITVMVPWHDAGGGAQFKADFEAKYGHAPDWYAYNAYEAALVALEAIARSETGKRADIASALFRTVRSNTVLGDYRFTPDGDIDPPVSGYVRLDQIDASPTAACLPASSSCPAG